MTMIFSDPPAVRGLCSTIVFEHKYMLLILLDFLKINNFSCVSFLYLSYKNEDFREINKKTHTLNNLLKCHICWNTV